MAKWPAWLTPALLACLTALMGAPFLFGGRVLYWGTPLLQFVPWRQAAVEQLQAGWLPLWLAGVGAGAPLLANHQTAALYPLNVLFLIWPAERALGYAAALHIFLAGLGMALLGRSLRLSRPAALVGAIAYMFSAFIIARLNFPSMTCASAWAPYLWLFGGRLAARRKVGDMLALAGVIALQFLAGHAQLWYYSLWALGLYVLACCVARPWDAAGDGGPEAHPTSQPRPSAFAGALSSSWKPLALLAGAVALGIALAAAQFLPTAELALNSQRQSGAGYDFAMTYSFWPWRLLTFFAPDFFGSPAHGDYWGYANYWEDAGYVGILPLLLLVPALRGWRAGRKAGGAPGTRLVPFLLGFLLVALLLALGKNLPLYPLVFRYIPGFGAFQAPARFLFWATLALALLAAIGADQMAAWAGRDKAARLLLVGGIGLALAGLATQILLAAVKVTFGPAVLRAGLLLSLSSVPILLSAAPATGRWGRLGRAWPALALLVLAGDLLSWGLPFNPTTSPAAYAPFENQTVAALRRDAPGLSRVYTFAQAEYDLKFKRFLSFKDFGDASAERQRALRETLLPNAHLLEGIESANNFDSLLEGRYQRLMDVINAAEPATALRLLGLMNVAHIIQPPAEIAAAPQVAPVIQSAALSVVRNPAARPRAWWVPAGRAAPDADAALAAIQAPDFDPRRQVVLETAEVLPLSDDGAASDAPVALTYRPNGVTIAFSAPAAGYLVLADAWYPGWRATVAGRPAEVLRANYAFRAVAVSAGEQSITFTYAPASARIGGWISLASLAGVLIGGAAIRRRTKYLTPERTA